MQEEAVRASVPAFYYKSRYQYRKDKSRCSQCGDSLSAWMQTLTCWVCWLKIEANAAGLLRHQWRQLEDLWFEQHATCTYTGERLIPGVNASLDHKQPKSKGGTNNPSNLHWVTRSVNSSKGSTPHEQFIEKRKNAGDIQ